MGGGWLKDFGTGNQSCSQTADELYLELYQQAGGGRSLATEKGLGANQDLVRKAPVRRR